MPDGTRRDVVVQVAAELGLSRRAVYRPGALSELQGPRRARPRFVHKREPLRMAISTVLERIRQSDRLNVTHVVILAAGQGTRMKSSLPKVLHRVGGLALIDHVIRTASTVSPDTVTVVTGHAKRRVRDHLVISHLNIQTALQEPQLGTAHALQQAEPLLAGKSGRSCCCRRRSACCPGRTLGNLVERHNATGAAATVRHRGSSRSRTVTGELFGLMTES